jgi:N-acetylglutamate synthase-like GNAT family acetyltransferase
MHAASKFAEFAEFAEFAIRPATTNDIPALLELVEQSVRQLQWGDYSPAQIDASIGTAFGVDRQLLADGTYFVATPSEDPARLVACGGWSYRRTMCGSDSLGHRDATVLDPADPAAYAKIRAIFVHPEWARRGLGSLVLAHCEAAAQAAGFQRFEMGSTLTGVPLYSRRGYIERSRSRLDLTRGESIEIVHMDKCLEPLTPLGAPRRAS